MSKNIDEIVEGVLPKNYQDWDYDLARNHLAQALTEGKLCVPMSREEIKEALAEWMMNTKDKKMMMWDAIYEAQFGGNK